jgi:diadenosine tetraphosphate (Ap4A) HIT family hydrolase
MTDPLTCFVCRKHRGLEAVPGGPIYEDGLVFSGHSWSTEDQNSPYLGGLIVEPKRHLPTWAELNDNEAETIGRVIRDVAKALMGEEGVDHVYVFVLGHHVPHLHIWVVPRYAQTPREYWGFNIFDWPGRPSGGVAQVEELCERIRARL